MKRRPTPWYKLEMKGPQLCYYVQIYFTIIAEICPQLSYKLSERIARAFHKYLKYLIRRPPRSSSRSTPHQELGCNARGGRGNVFHLSMDTVEPGGVTLVMNRGATYHLLVLINVDKLYYGTFE